MPFGYFLSSYLKSLGYLKILQGGKPNFFSSYTEAAQDFQDEVDTKNAKSFGWIKEYSSPNSQSLATPAHSFPELTRIPKPVNTGVENATKLDRFITPWAIGNMDAN